MCSGFLLNTDGVAYELPDLVEAYYLQDSKASNIFSCRKCKYRQSGSYIK